MTQPSPMSQPPATRPEPVPHIASKVFMWLMWLFFASFSVLMAYFLTAKSPKLNSFAGRTDLFTFGVAAIPILLCGGLRFWISRIRNPWLALLPYFGGILFAQQAGLYGIFLVPEFCILFQILSAVLFALFLPPLVRTRPVPVPPPLA